MPNTTSINLGQVAAVITSPIAPTNLNVVWLNTSSNPTVKMVWDPVGLQWIPLTGGGGGGGGDNWGTQVVESDATLAGEGVTTNLLKIAQQGATTGQVLKWNGITWLPANESTGTGLEVVTVDTNIFQGDGTIENPIGLQPTSNGYIPKYNAVTNKWYFAPDNVGDSFVQAMIIMWSGSINQIPSGWALCDGNNGVAINGVQIPDLRGKFIGGVGSITGFSVIGETGGAANVTLTPDQMPEHTHGVSDPGHNHTQNAVISNRDDANDGYLDGHNPTDGSWQTGTSSTGITILPAGEGQSFSILPPYYTLAFLIRTATT